MDTFQSLSSLSALPIVDLRNIQQPADGLLVKVSKTCEQNYAKSEQCRRHYETLSKNIIDQGTVVQCPFGFGSAPFRVGEIFAAVTSFVPYPRLGGSKERMLAKRHPEAKINGEILKKTISAIAIAETHLRELEKAAVQDASLALHEIRKLNATIKQTAERLCRKDSPNDPDAAKPELVRIWKTSELMSNEFDVIEFLANANLAELPVNHVSEPYKLFHKLVRIYNERAGGRKLVLSGGDARHSPRIAACDKTFHIIPSVFIENALKYSAPGSEIRIFLGPDEDGEHCVIKVTNESEGQQLLDDRVFLRGYRANKHGDGSGNGLFIAQEIAKQHKSLITVQSSIVSQNRLRHSFELVLKAI
jgi:signal transduction histidine kinase